MQIYLSYLGCRLNQAELELWARQYRLAGHEVVKSADDADLIVLNSCAVTQEAVRKSRKNIKQLKRRNPDARVVVSGCFVSLQDDSGNRETAEALAVDLVVHNSDKQMLVEQSCRLFEVTKTAETKESGGPSARPAATPAIDSATNPDGDADIARKSAARWMPLKQIDITSDRPANPGVASQPKRLQPIPGRQRQRAFIKIQDGCRYRCTYCVVTLARGDEVSRPIAELVNEVNTLVAEGIKEIVLTGVHVGGYGSDTGESLASLLRALLCDTAVPRIRFASVEPWDLEADLLSCLQHPRVMPHMHLPLQSGSDTVLKRMARRCKTADFKQLVNELQASIDGFNVTTDIIVGFPGETESEWQQTLDFVNTIAFGHIHVFPFSIRAGTKAARLPGQLTGDIKKRRVRQLRELALQQRQNFLQRCVGQQVDVLWERYTPPSYGQTKDTKEAEAISTTVSESATTTGIAIDAKVHGLTPNYIKVVANLPAQGSVKRQAETANDTASETPAESGSSQWVNHITPATLGHLQVIPGKSENELPDYLMQARVPAI